MLVASTVWMLVIDVPLGLVAVVVFPLLLVTNVVYEKSVSSHFTRARGSVLGEFSAGVHESFEGVQLVKSYGAEERETERLGLPTVFVPHACGRSGCGAGSRRCST